MEHIKEGSQLDGTRDANLVQVEKEEDASSHEPVILQDSPSTSGPTGSEDKRSELQTTTTPRTVSSKLGLKKKKSLYSTEETKLYKFAQLLRKRVKKLKTVKDHIKAAMILTKYYGVRHSLENLTPTQQRFFENLFKNYKYKPRGRSFTFEETADAFAIYKCSPRTYKLLSKVFVLPSKRTLKATLDKVRIRPGISSRTFEVLSRKLGRRRSSRICTLIFGETELEPLLDYLPPEDDVMAKSAAIAHNVIVFMLRGVYKRWKQPVAFAFSLFPMKASIIVSFYKQIVAEAAAVGLNIVASVCDMGGNNVKAINDLLDYSKRVRSSEDGVVSNNVIRIPLPDNNYHEVIPLFDPPHLLKAFRNCLMERDCQFTNVDKRGQQQRMVAKWEYIKNVVDIDLKESIYRLLPKLSAQHVVTSKMRKSNVLLAAQVMSHQVTRIVYLFSWREHGRFPQDAYDTAILVLKMDQIFDSVNGGFGVDEVDKILRRRVGPYSSHYKTWMEGRRMFSNLVFLPKNAADRPRPKCVMGWQRTLKGFCLIKRTLRKLGFRQFPARAFNQDPLENFFAQTKPRRGHAYPSYKAFISFYKCLLVRSFSAYYTPRSNCEKDSDEVLVTIGDLLSDP